MLIVNVVILEMKIVFRLNLNSRRLFYYLAMSRPLLYGIKTEEDMYHPKSKFTIQNAFKIVENHEIVL